MLHGYGSGDHARMPLPRSEVDDFDDQAIADMLGLDSGDAAPAGERRLARGQIPCGWVGHVGFQERGSVGLS